MIKLGFTSAILPDFTFDQVCETASAIGYDCVEIMCWPLSKAERRYAGITHIDVSRLEEADGLERIKRQLDKAAVRISGLGYYPNCLSPDPGEASIAVEHVKQVLRATRVLGLSNFNTFIGRDYTQSVDSNWPRLLETWRPIMRLADELGIRVGIENCPMYFSRDEWPGGKNIATTPAIWERLFSDIDSPNLGLNYDPSHMIWQHMDYLAPLNEFKDRIFHVHAKDVRLDREKLNRVGIMAHPLEFHTPKLPGLGEIDWGKFISVLLDTGYRGDLCVEVEDRAYEEDEASRVASLQQSYRYLKNFLP